MKDVEFKGITIDTKEFDFYSVYFHFLVKDQRRSDLRLSNLSSRRINFEKYEDVIFFIGSVFETSTKLGGFSEIYEDWENIKSLAIGSLIYA
jgi:hypothetical protein